MRGQQNNKKEQDLEVDLNGHSLSPIHCAATPRPFGLSPSALWKVFNGPTAVSCRQTGSLVKHARNRNCFKFFRYIMAAKESNRPLSPKKICSKGIQL